MGRVQVLLVPLVVVLATAGSSNGEDIQPLDNSGSVYSVLPAPSNAHNFLSSKSNFYSLSGLPAAPSYSHTNGGNFRNKRAGSHNGGLRASVGHGFATGGTGSSNEYGEYIQSLANSASINSFLPVQSSKLPAYASDTHTYESNFRSSGVPGEILRRKRGTSHYGGVRHRGSVSQVSSVSLGGSVSHGGSTSHGESENFGDSSSHESTSNEKFSSHEEEAHLYGEQNSDSFSSLGSIAEDSKKLQSALKFQISDVGISSNVGGGKLKSGSFQSSSSSHSSWSSQSASNFGSESGSGLQQLMKTSIGFPLLTDSLVIGPSSSSFSKQSSFQFQSTGRPATGDTLSHVGGIYHSGSLSHKGSVIHEASLNKERSTSNEGSLNNQGIIRNTESLIGEINIDNFGKIDNVASKQARVSKIASLSIEGSLNHDGGIRDSGSVSHVGSISDLGSVNNEGKTNNNAIISQDASINQEASITNQASVSNKGSVSLDGSVSLSDSVSRERSVTDEGSVSNLGKISNDASITHKASVSHEASVSGVVSMGNGVNLRNGGNLRHEGGVFHGGSIRHAGSVSHEGRVSDLGTISKEEKIDHGANIPYDSVSNEASVSGDARVGYEEGVSHDAGVRHEGSVRHGASIRHGGSVSNSGSSQSGAFKSSSSSQSSKSSYSSSSSSSSKSSQSSSSSHSSISKRAANELDSQIPNDISSGYSFNYGSSGQTHQQSGSFQSSSSYQSSSGFNINSNYMKNLRSHLHDFSFVPANTIPQSSIFIGTGNNYRFSYGIGGEVYPGSVLFNSPATSKSSSSFKPHSNSMNELRSHLQRDSSPSFLPNLKFSPLAVDKAYSFSYGIGGNVQQSSSFESSSSSQSSTDLKSGLNSASIVPQELPSLYPIPQVIFPVIGSGYSFSYGSDGGTDKQSSSSSSSSSSHSSSSLSQSSSDFNVDLSSGNLESRQDLSSLSTPTIAQESVPTVSSSHIFSFGSGGELNQKLAIFDLPNSNKPSSGFNVDLSSSVPQSQSQLPDSSSIYSASQANPQDSSGYSFTLSNGGQINQHADSTSGIDLSSANVQESQSKAEKSFQVPSSTLMSENTTGSGFSFSLSSNEGVNQQFGSSDLSSSSLLSSGSQPLSQSQDTSSLSSILSSESAPDVGSAFSFSLNSDGEPNQQTNSLESSSSSHSLGSNSVINFANEIPSQSQEGSYLLPSKIRQESRPIIESVFNFNLESGRDIQQSSSIDSQGSSELSSGINLDSNDEKRSQSQESGMIESTIPQGSSAVGSGYSFNLSSDADINLKSGSKSADISPEISSLINYKIDLSSGEVPSTSSGEFSKYPIIVAEGPYAAAQK